MSEQQQQGFLWVGRSDSSCSVCNRPASPRETSHQTSGWWYVDGELKVKEGCGAIWTHRKSSYISGSSIKELFNWDDMSKPFFKNEALLDQARETTDDGSQGG